MTLPSEPAIDWRALFEAAPDRYLVLDASLRVVAVSTAYLEATMTARDGIVGRSLFDVFPDAPGDGMADGVAHLRASLTHVLATRRPHAMATRRYPIRRPDGTVEERHWRPLHTPVLDADGAVALIVHRIDDMTEIVRIEQSRRDGERALLEAAAQITAARLQNAVESMDDAFALFDADDRLILCNAVYQRLIAPADDASLVGKTYGDILGAWIPRIDFADEGDCIRFREQRLARGDREHTTSFDVLLRDGRSLRVVERWTTEGGIVKTIWDRTEDVRRARELDAARAAAEAASAAKSEFLASMSHELRTPLNAILGFAQLMQRDKREPLSARNVDRIAHVVTGGEHLLRLIDDVLDLSRIESGTMSVSLEPVDVGRVIADVVETLRPLAARQGIQVRVDAQGGNVPAGHDAAHRSRWVRADRTRLAQILMNLGSNAIKYNRPAGEVRFSVVAGDAGAVRLMVTDTGLGIAAAKQDVLFQPFQRAGQETGPIEGTGIGLVITKRLAALMDGSVGFRSAAGRGSTFWVDLPTLRDSSPPTPRPTSRPSVSLPAVRTSRTVLYVEDNPANVELMRDLLGAIDGFELLVAGSAERGLQLARARRPSLIIMDVNLPGMSGLEAVRTLKAAPETRAIPIIALSAAASERDRQRGVQAGFQRYLSKPVDVDQLIAAVEALLPPNVDALR